MAEDERESKNKGDETAASPRESAATTEALGSAEEAHRRCPEGRSEQGASKAKHRPSVGVSLGAAAPWCGSTFRERKGRGGSP